MSDSDDNYFPDDLVLDDKALAVLDEEESKFKRATANLNTQTQQSVTVGRLGPPAKRQKTTGSWQPQSVSKTIFRAATLDDMEDLPDISIQQDGTYGLLDKQGRTLATPSRSGITSGSNVITQAGSGAGPTASAPSSRGSVPPMCRTSASGPVRTTAVPARPLPSARGMRTTQSPISSQDVSRTQPGSLQRADRNVSSMTPPSAYVEQLLQQIEEVWYLAEHGWVVRGLRFLSYSFVNGMNPFIPKWSLLWRRSLPRMVR